ncbi:RNA polymerase sigma-70 factor [Pedobacter sp. KBW06]|uniref:RNA polymerase sigma-70 factor n=1 Tax=Pedobacter sp. KBW06 TaxID=2153359 RepID=UPI000F5AF9B4|nr:RNA polymerase sigma-70 factor [Pedobacter sp. KBW06]RQO74472.1 RNA polymerase sigma-70 factor [Pedobacter sp. KBW06]
MQVKSLKILFDAYYDRLVYFCFKITDNKEQAKDITQDAFLKYWQLSDEVANNETAIKNFLYSTVHNAALNAVRHDKVVNTYAQKQCGNEPTDGDIMEGMINAEVFAEIHLAIDSLPEQYRKISIMGYFEGKKNQEIADELGMSINTVKKQKQKALELLRIKLRPELFGAFLFLFK